MSFSRLGLEGYGVTDFDSDESESGVSVSQRVDPRFAIIAFPNLIDTASLSGGNWLSSLPVTNLQTRILQEVATSASVDPDDTQFTLNFERLRNVRAFAFANHNLSLSAQFRVTASLEADFDPLSYDSGWLDVWPIIYPYGSLAWEDESWWTGKYTEEEIAGSTWTRSIVLDENVLAQYWRVEFDDQSNAAGKVSIGRPFISSVWQPVRNMGTGTASLGMESRSIVSEALSGAEYFDRFQAPRIAQFTLPWMDTDEAMSRALEIMRRADIHGEILYIWDPTDTRHAIRRQFIGRLRKLSQIEYVEYELHSVAWEIKELL